MIKWITDIDLQPMESQDYYHFYDNRYCCRSFFPSKVGEVCHENSAICIEFCRRMSMQRLPRTKIGGTSRSTFATT